MGINITSAQMTGTTDKMQYSLNSTNGTDGSWLDATDNVTDITFTAGNVYVREKAMPSNYRLVETIAPAVAAPIGIAIDVSTNQITGTTDTQQYSLDGGSTWSDTTAANTAVTFSLGNLVLVREKATVSKLASLTTAAIHVTEGTIPNAVITQGTADGTVKLKGLINDIQYEYIVDANPTIDKNAATWLQSTSVTGGEIDNISVAENQIIHLRAKATASSYVSEAKSIQVTSNDIRSFEKDVATIKATYNVPYPVADKGSYQSIALTIDGATLKWTQIHGSAYTIINQKNATLYVSGSSGSTATFKVEITKGNYSDTKEIVVTIK